MGAVLVRRETEELAMERLQTVISLSAAGEISSVLWHLAPEVTGQM